MSVAELKLVKRKDLDNSDIESVDLLSLPIELQYEGWQQATPQQQGQSSVDDVINLLMNAGDDDALATALQSIDTKVKEVQWAQDPLNPIGIWLRSKLRTETFERQAFILNARRSPAMRITDPLAYDSILQQYQLGLTRAPAWEDVLATSITNGLSQTSSHGGTIPYTIGGDAHARVSILLITANGSYTFREVWFGIKSNRYGVDPANFQPVWHLSDNGYTSPDTTNVSDGTALNGTKRVCTFATVTTMNYRAVVDLNTVTSYPTDQRGKYIVLLRAKTSDASLIANVRVGHGYLISSSQVASFAFQPRYQIANANTGWTYYTLGMVRLPPTGGFFDQSMKATALAIQAEKVSGTGNLELDNLILIPAEHAIHASNQAETANKAISSTTDWGLLTRPDGKIFAAAQDHTTNIVYQAPIVDASAWSIPAGIGRIVCAGSSPITTVADEFYPIFFVYPAYSSLRGFS